MLYLSKDLSIMVVMGTLKYKPWPICSFLQKLLEATHWGVELTWERFPPVQTQNAAAVFLFTTAIFIASISSLKAAIGDRLDRSQLVQTFDEEFSSPVSFYSALTGKGVWKTSFYWGAQGYYTSREENDTGNIFSDTAYNGVNPFVQGNNLMAITAAVDGNPSKPNNNNYPYTSGLLSTEKSFTQTYGYFETQVALPVGQGLWPGFWMLSETQGAAEEIDVMESLGHNSNTTYSSLHYLPATPHIGITFTIPVANTAVMHTYGVLWTSTNLSFYVDDIKVASYINPGFHDPMYLLLCLQVGAAGSWPGPPNATTTFPSQMLIRYVRAYSTSVSPSPVSTPGAPIGLRVVGP
jgi:beta-glucanase (GH16 family)